MICIQICSNREWRAIKEMFNLEENQVETYPLGECVKMKYAGKQCVFYHSGATKTRSAAACQFAMDNWKPELIVVAGTCGGVDESLKVMDVIIASKTAQYDCLNRMGNEPYVFYEPFTMDIDNSWIDFSGFDQKVLEGIVATADQDVNYETREILRKENVLCADWESGAIAFICSLNKVKCCIVRGISDVPKENTKESEISQGMDYRKNTPLVMKKLVEDVLPVILKYA